MKLSVIVPMLNEEGAIRDTLLALRAAAKSAETIVVDGGSTDSSCDIARPLCDCLLQSKAGRARQMNAGAAAAHGDVLAFVHADTIVPAGFAEDIAAAMRDPSIVGGRFDVELDAPGPVFRLIGNLISLRSRLSRTGTGDQAIFVRRDIFARLGGFANLELCEDLDLTRRLKRAGAIACLRSRVTTSARRWRKDGLLRTIVRMWIIRILFLLGVSATRLKRSYRNLR